LSVLSNAASTPGDQKIRQAIFDTVQRGKIIDGQSYPYSPSLAGAKNQRALLADATAAVAQATAPRQWLPHDLEAVTTRAIGTMIDDGSLVAHDMEKLMAKPGRFRKGRGLKANPALPLPADQTALDVADTNRPTQVASEAAEAGGIPFMITQAMKAQLSERGYSAEQIDNMSPAEANEILGKPPPQGTGG
jgi:hypothetical protein